MRNGFELSFIAQGLGVIHTFSMSIYSSDQVIFRSKTIAAEAKVYLKLWFEDLRAQQGFCGLELTTRWLPGQNRTNALVPKCIYT